MNYNTIMLQCISRTFLFSLVPLLLSSCLVEDFRIRRDVEKLEEILGNHSEWNVESIELNKENIDPYFELKQDVIHDYGKISFYNFNKEQGTFNCDLIRGADVERTTNNGGTFDDDGNLFAIHIHFSLLDSMRVLYTKDLIEVNPKRIVFSNYGAKKVVLKRER